MEDRFKFRIWRPTNIHIIDWKPRFIYQDILEEDYCVIRQDNDVYEFCTGLKDKNGKLIYEGDILSVKVLDWKRKEKCKSVKTYWSVEYKNYWNYGGFVVFGINRRFHHPLSRTTIFNSEAVIIGNIHENPELLKDSK